MIKSQAIYSTRNLAILAICAGVLVAAISIRSFSAPVVRDPQNPAFVGNTIGSSTTNTSGQTVRDPENPYWQGATATETGVTGSGGRAIETGYRGATQGLR